MSFDGIFVQALYDFNTGELNEIAFRRGDILKVSPTNPSTKFISFPYKTKVSLN
jgi:hypothetical protein